MSRQMGQSRQCAKPTCDNLAAATLSYHYETATVWVEHLHAEGHPMTHDLCLRHADGMVVPQGWTLEDARFGAPVAPGALPLSQAS